MAFTAKQKKRIAEAKARGQRVSAGIRETGTVGGGIEREVQREARGRRKKGEKVTVTRGKEGLAKRAGKAIKKGAAFVQRGIERVQQFVDQPGAAEAREKLVAGEELTPEEQRAVADISGRVIIGGGVARAGAKVAAKTVQAFFKGLVNKATTLFTSKGLSNPKVANAAIGQLPQKIPSGYGFYNPKSAALNLNIVKKLTTTMKYSVAVGGVVGSAVLNGFLEEEADQSVSFTIDKALRDGDIEFANELMEFRTELLDKDMWDYLKLLIPGKGLYTYLKAARFKLRQQQKEAAKVTKTLEEGFEPSAVEQAKRKESEEYYAAIKDAQARAKAEERKADEKYYANIRKDLERERATTERKAFDPEEFKKSQLTFGLLK